MKKQQIEDIIQSLVTAYMNCAESLEFEKMNKLTEMIEYWSQMITDMRYY